MAITLAALRAMRDQLNAVAARHGVTRIRVFGSVARGDEKGPSDVDLLVALGPKRTLLDLVGFEQDASNVLGCTVDVVVEGGLHPALEQSVLSEAVAI